MLKRANPAANQSRFFILNPVRVFARAILFLFCLGTCGQVSVALAAEKSGDNIDVSNVKPPNCRKCGNKGWVRCSKCHGRGFTFDAQVKCPKCKGKRVVDCHECNDEGKVRCSGKCRLRTINGKKMYGVVNPEWKEWMRQYGGKANNTFSRKKDDDTPPEPMHYIGCRKCMGKGYVLCPYCRGTKKRPCPKCKGKGWVKGKGSCPACHGSKHMPCPTCASLEGVDKKITENLAQLHEKQLITDAEYYKRRRILTAQAKRRREILAERARKQEKLAKTAADKKKSNAVSVKGKQGKTIEQRKEELKILAEAFANKAISLKLYREKVRSLGLSADAMQQVEKQVGKNNARMKKYVSLKQAFRDGRLDLEQFNRRLDDL